MKTIPALLPKINRRYKNVIILFCLVVVCVTVRQGVAHAQERPTIKAHQYNGVASCASSNCHGSAVPRDSTPVLQNEYVTWSKHDAHSKAWLSLVSPEGKRIGEHLGITNPEKEPWCLSCHATYVKDPKQVGPEFKVEDGVGCESCHGASEGYLQEHTKSGTTNQRNIELGLVNLADLNTRANTCVTCHYGSKDADVTHRLMGAGHPRLSFELDTFTALEPMHWRIDDDYKTRKGDYAPARAWLIGQLALARATVNRFSSKERANVHAWPELTLMACYSCHHSLSTNQWKTRDYAGQPGELRLNTAVFFMLERALSAFSTERTDEFHTAVLAIEQSFREGKLQTDSAQFATALSKAEQFLLAQKLDDGSLKRLMRSMLAWGLSFELLQYEQAEQITMGISAFDAQLSGNESLYKNEMKAIYDSLESPSEFDAVEYRKASGVLLKKL